MKPLTLIIETKPQTLSIELTKALTFNSLPLEQRLAVVETNNTAQDTKITELETINTEQNTKIDYINNAFATRITVVDAQLNALKDCVNIRYYQSATKPTASPPMPADALLRAKLGVEVQANSFGSEFYAGYSETRGGDFNQLGTLSDNTFTLNGKDYKIFAIYDGWNKRTSSTPARYTRLFIVNKENSNKAIASSIFNNICIRVENKVFMPSEADWIGSYLSFVFGRKVKGATFLWRHPVPEGGDPGAIPSPLGYKNNGKDIDVFIEPLEWTAEIPKYQSNTKLYMATKNAGVWQVVRVIHPDEP